MLVPRIFLLDDFGSPPVDVAVERLRTGSDYFFEVQAPLERTRLERRRREETDPPDGRRQEKTTSRGHVPVRSEAPRKRRKSRMVGGASGCAGVIPDGAKAGAS